ncbi:hypothetical protein Axi01nite_97340 [Actinoplanes xinjiangensis]|nr:hypothetical protein Axi01nite_97340 [Actinoplanes xinjiangensis]
MIAGARASNARTVRLASSAACGPGVVQNDTHVEFGGDVAVESDGEPSELDGPVPAGSRLRDTAVWLPASAVSERVNQCAAFVGVASKAVVIPFHIGIGDRA